MKAVVNMEICEHISVLHVLLSLPSIISSIFAGLICQGIVCTNRSEIWAHDHEFIFLVTQHFYKNLFLYKKHSYDLRGNLVYIDYSSFLTVVKNDNTVENFKLHGYNGDPKLENLLYQFGVFLILCRVIWSEPLKVVRYSRSRSEMQSIQNDLRATFSTPWQHLLESRTLLKP